MEVESNLNLSKRTKHHNSLWHTLNYSIIYTLILTTALILVLIHNRNLPSYLLSSGSSSALRDLRTKWTRVPVLGPSKTQESIGDAGNESPGSHDPVIFLPLQDLRYAETAMEGNTWFMSSLNDTLEEGESEHLYFPSRESGGRLLCLKGRDAINGTRNSYALAWPGSLPEQAVLLGGLTFVSDTYYDYGNLWHGLTALAPFVGWSMKNQCVKPSRWILYHRGELRDRMGSWIGNVMDASYGEVQVESFELWRDKDDTAYCFEEAVVMRHNIGKMGKEKKIEVTELLRCRAREYCGIPASSAGGQDPPIRLTLLMRRGSRSFENATAVINVFAKECEMVSGCILKVVQSEELNFCDQVRVMSETDIVASPHGAQLTNMLFMEKGSSVMEFFPRGWFELAGVGQYAHHWMAELSGMKHRGAWWEPLGNKDCPNPGDDLDCFGFYKDGKVGHNETHFAAWARDVLNQVKIAKQKDQSAKSLLKKPSVCAC